MKPAKNPGKPSRVWGRGPKRHRTPHLDRLPEPARSVGRDVLEHGEGKDSQKAEALAAHQAEEWMASRAPTARPVREHGHPKRKS